MKSDRECDGMSEKSKYGKSSSTSEAKRHFGEKLNQSSSVGSKRKEKLHGKNRLEVRNVPLRGQDVREEDSESERNVAEEVVRSGNRTGEYLYESAGKAAQKRRRNKKRVTAEQKHGKEAFQGTSSMFGKIRNGIENTARKMGEDAAKFVADNPIPVLCAGILGVLLITVSAGLSSCTMMFGAFQGATLTTTYTADDSEILAADDHYSELEEQLETQKDEIEETYPGYDEYVYTLDAVGHDSYQLASLLTILYEDYTESEVEDTLQDIFEKQYVWSFEEAEETRILEETKTRLELKTRLEEREGTTIRWDKELGKYVWDVYTYEEEVEYWEEVEYQEDAEYQCRILKVTLTNGSIDGVVESLGLTEEQLQRYEILTTMKGNKDYLF